jgi:hypothetical protein
LPRWLFDGFELMTPGAAEDDDFILLAKDATDLPVWPLDVCMAHPTASDLGWTPGS